MSYRPHTPTLTLKARLIIMGRVCYQYKEGHWELNEDLILQEAEKLKNGKMIWLKNKRLKI